MTSINTVLNKNGINMTPDQLVALIKAIQTTSSRNNSNEQLNNLNLDDEVNFRQNNNRSRFARTAYDDDINISVYRPPKVVIASDEEIEINQNQYLNKQKSTSLEQLNNTDRHNLLEKKKQKWQQDKG